MTWLSTTITKWILLAWIIVVVIFAVLLLVTLFATVRHYLWVKRSDRSVIDRNFELIKALTMRDLKVHPKNIAKEFNHMYPGLRFADLRCTGNRNTCPMGYCWRCSVRVCPHHNPMHLLDTGCPVCFPKGVA